MFINFWYTAGKSTDVGAAPIRTRMLGQDFVLFRDTSGAVRCLADTCIHRGASLGNGKVKGDCIQCPYHGWQFSGDGFCRSIPSLGAQAKIPGRARVDAYPTDVRPVVTPEKNTAEFFTPADISIAKYRHKLQRWEHRGWRIDADTVARNRKRVAYAIPCPARREAKGWVLDSIPLRPAAAGATVGAASAANAKHMEAGRA